MVETLTIDPDRPGPSELHPVDPDEILVGCDDLSATDRFPDPGPEADSSPKEQQ